MQRLNALVLRVPEATVVHFSIGTSRRLMGEAWTAAKAERRRTESDVNETMIIVRKRS